MTNPLQRGPRGGWAASVASPRRRVGRRLNRALPTLVALGALVVGAWMIWPEGREEPVSAPLPTVAPVADPVSTSLGTLEPEAATIAPVMRDAIDAFRAGRDGGAKVQLFTPAAVPRGWVLERAEVVPAAVTSQHCDQVGIFWTDPTRPSGGVLDVYQYPRPCASPRPPGAEDFAVAGSKGWIARDDSGLWRAQFFAGGTAVEIFSDLGAADLAAMFSTRTPFDVQRPPPATYPVAS